MAGEKYVVATVENPLQITVRNMLNPSGYVFLGNCSDSVSLLRLIRSYNPDFIVVDYNMQLRELKQVIETVDDEMLCSSILIGDYKNMELADLVEKSKVVAFCPKPLSREVLLTTVEMANLSFRRVSELNKKLHEMTENYETRKVVERAKWLLIERDGISETEAYEKMRRKSMDSRLSMRAIADAIIFTHELSKKS